VDSQFCFWNNGHVIRKDGRKVGTEFSYGKKTQELREEKAWTQEQLADAASLDVRTIQRVEKDQTKSPETIQAIAGAFDVDVDRLRTTKLIPETRLAGTWLATSYREFLSIERTQRAHQGARMTVSPLSDEDQTRVDDLLRKIFADREFIEPDEPGLWACYEQHAQEPLQELFGLDHSIFVMLECKDFILPDVGQLKPTQRCIDNWRVLYHLVVPRHGCFQIDSEKTMHRFNPACHEAGETIFRAVKEAHGGALVYSNALFALNHPEGKSRIQWCDTCFPLGSDGLRIGIDYITEVTGKDPAELYAAYIEATEDSFIVGLS
jgi:transcriptional regulator with XRE-family HTH domain